MAKVEKGTIADKVIECLEAEGVQFIAGVPGEENSEFLMALDRAQKKGSKIQFILTRHEQGASFIVESIARLTMKPQVALTTLGPGATNIVTGVANALLDKIPLVFISGQADSIRLHRSSFQNINTLDLFEPITLYNTSIRNAESVNEVVRKCFKVATVRQGPTHFELSRDIAKLEIGEKAWSQYKPLVPTKAYMPAPNEQLLKESLSFIRAAKKPILLVGYNTIRTGAVEAVRKFVEKAKIMTLNTPIAKGVIDARSDYALFTVGFVNEKLQLQALNDSDCIITAGFDQTEFSPEKWNINMNTNIVHIDSLRPTEVNRFYNPKFEIIGDISAAFNYFVQEKLEFPKSPFNFRKELIEKFTQLKDEETSGFLHAEKVLCDLRLAMKEDDILVSDVGAHMLYITKVFQCYQPNTCLISTGLATMGFGLPAAIGAKLVHPERNVVAICGDGGFLMNSQEMETAKRLGANVVVIIFKDDEYGMITLEQQQEYQKNVFTSFTNPDFVLLAKSFGWQGREVKTSKEFPAALQEAFAMAKSSPVLLQVPVDYKSRYSMLSAS